MVRRWWGGVGEEGDDVEPVVVDRAGAGVVGKLLPISVVLLAGPSADANPPLRAWIAVTEGIVAFAAGRRAESAQLLREAKALSEEGWPYGQAYVAFQVALRAAAPAFDIDPAAAY